MSTARTRDTTTMNRLKTRMSGLGRPLTIYAAIVFGIFLEVAFVDGFLGGSSILSNLLIYGVMSAVGAIGPAVVVLGALYTLDEMEV